MKILVALAVALSSTFAFAISDKDRDAFYSDYQNKINPLFDSRGVLSFEGVDQKKIAYQTFPVENEKGAVVIITGRAEPMKKYRELTYDVVTQGYSVYLMDHRGQGYSDRLLADHEMSHVRKFEDYAQDLDTFVRQVVKPADHKKFFIMAHSMGGAVVETYLRIYKPKVDGVVLSSPMFEMNLGKYSRLQANLLLLKARALRKMDTYVPGGKGYNYDETFDGNITTHSELRFEVNHQLVKDEAILAVGSPTYRWVGTCLGANDKILKEAAKMEYSTLILEAGDDQIVQPRGEEEFLKKAKNVSILRFPTAKHEIFQESDAVRDPAMTAAFEFLNGH